MASNEVAQRRGKVAMLLSLGLSRDAAAERLGVSRSTIARDVQGIVEAIGQSAGDLEQIAAQGDRLAALQHLRQILAREIDAGPEPRDLAALSRRMMLVLQELEGLDSGEEADVVDDLTARRQARRADAKGGVDPAVRL